MTNPVGLIIFSTSIVFILLFAAVRYNSNDKNSNLNLESIKIRVSQLKKKIINIIDLRTLTLTINSNESANVVDKQNSMIKYLIKYYEKYTTVLFSYDIKYLIDDEISKYNETHNDENLYNNVLSRIEDTYSNYSKDPILIKSNALGVIRDEYISKIKSILINIISTKTKDIIKNISPVEDSFETLEKVITELDLTVDVNELNNEYDRFISEQEILEI